MKKDRYDNLDGLRAYACIGIVLMHVLANGKFDLDGFVFSTLIFSFTNFTFLFMLLSAFSMCCGYYVRFLDNTISLEQFYKRRYQRIWPCFALLCTIELLVHRDLKSLYEWFADLTLSFGLIPNNNIEVVGVGWFIGTIFVFYMVFPYFVFLINGEKRAWFTLLVSVILHLLCMVFFTETGGRANIVFSAMFFVAGGLIYLYRDRIKEIRISAMIFLLTAIIVYYTLNSSVVLLLIVFTTMTIVAIAFDNFFTKIIFQNKFISSLGMISMEIYLCHMFVFRAIEKLKLLSITTNPLLNYVLVFIGTIIGAMVLATILKTLIGLVEKEMARVV